MKRPRPPLPLLAIALLLTPALGHAQTPEPKMIDVHGRFLYATAAQMDAAQKAANIPPGPIGPLSPEHFTLLRRKLAESGADFFSDPRTLVKSGQRAVVAAVRELRYPTKYEPSRNKPGKFVPIAFETRNVGVTLEFEAIARPDSKVDLNLAPEVTTFLGFIDYAGGKPVGPGGETAIDALLKTPLTAGGVWQPVFASFTLASGFTIDEGQTVLLGGMRKVGEVPVLSGPSIPPPGKLPPDEQQVFVFVTAKIVSPE